MMPDNEHLSTTQLFDLASDNADAELQAKAAFHVKVCADCKSRLDTEYQLLHQISLLETEHIPMAFTQQIMESIQKESVNIRQEIRKDLLNALFMLIAMMAVMKMIFSNAIALKPASPDGTGINRISGYIEYYSVQFRELLLHPYTLIILSIIIAMMLLIISERIFILSRRFFLLRGSAIIK
jgi:hypothetical protein